MANTLSLGSGNWGAKESLLLGYYENGKKFFPETFDVTRATGGTRVNKAGLIETPTEILSGELVANGNFSNGLTDWNISTSALGYVSTSSQTLQYLVGHGDYAEVKQLNNSVIGKRYKGSFKVISKGANANVLIQYGRSSIYSGSINDLSIGTHTFIVDSVNTDGFSISVRTNGIIEIDDVSVLEVNQNNLARIDYLDDAKGVLLTEPQSTNLVTYSESFNSWAQIQETSLIETETISPSGEANSIKFLSTGNSSKVRNNFSSVSGETYTFSVYCQNIDATQITILAYDGVNSFEKNIVTDINTSTWSRVSLTFTSTNTGAGQIQLGRNIPNGQSAYFWGAQLEQENALGYNGEYATSYIPTDGSTVTRNKDEVNNGGDVNSFGSEGVLYAEIAALANDGTNRNITISDGSTNNIIQIIFSSVSNTIRFIIRVGGVGGDNLDKSTSTYTVTDFNKVALKWKQNDAQVWINGTQLGSPDTNSDVPIGLNDLSFEYLTVGNNLFGKTKNIQVFNTALSDSDLLSLTTTGSVPYWTQYSAMATTLNYTNK